MAVKIEKFMRDSFNDMALVNLKGIIWELGSMFDVKEI